MEGNVIPVQPLSLSNIFQTFPDIEKNSHMKPLLKLIKIPFYLSAVTRLLSQIGETIFDYMVKTRIKRVGLEAELIQIIIHGHDANAISIRRLAWQQLAVKMLQTPSNCGIGAVVPNITDGLKLLQNEGIVIKQYNRYP